MLAGARIAFGIARLVSARNALIPPATSAYNFGALFSVADWQGLAACARTVWLPGSIEAVVVAGVVGALAQQAMTPSVQQAMTAISQASDSPVDAQVAVSKAGCEAAR